MEFALKEWQEIWIPELRERSIDFGILPEKVRKITVLTGLRRAGKTYLMFQLMKRLSASIPRERIFYVNFEDERIERKTENLTKLIPALFSLYGGEREYFLFLDEIQVMPEWSRWLRRVYDGYRNITFFVTGSSSKLSSAEIPTELRGRELSHQVFPLDLREFLAFKNIELEKGFDHSERKLSAIKKALSEFMEYGGFPEVVLEDSAIRKRRLVQEYFSALIGRDILERHNVKNARLLHDFLRLLLGTRYFSVNKAANVLRSQGMTAGKETLLKYISYIEGSYFCFLVPIFSRKIKEQMRYPKKVYFSDNAFLTNLSLRFSKDAGRLLENAVAVELARRRAKNPMLDFYYWKDRAGREVDFVLKDGLEIMQLVQVCHDPADVETKAREVKAMLKAGDELKCKNMLVITDDYEREETHENAKISFIPLWKWLLASKTD